MVCAAAMKGTKEHAQHYCMDCMYRDIDFKEPPCTFCIFYPDTCAWKKRED